MKQRLLRAAACCIGAGAVTKTSIGGVQTGFVAMLLAGVAKAEEETMLDQATVLSACPTSKCGSA